jgi:hypothetical protein
MRRRPSARGTTHSPGRFMMRFMKGLSPTGSSPLSPSIQTHAAPYRCQRSSPGCSLPATDPAFFDRRSHPDHRELDHRSTSTARRCSSRHRDVVLPVAAAGPGSRAGGSRPSDVPGRPARRRLRLQSTPHCCSREKRRPVRNWVAWCDSSSAFPYITCPVRPSASRSSFNWNPGIASSSVSTDMTEDNDTAPADGESWTSPFGIERGKRKACSPRLALAELEAP